jgi:hypothetical protein
MQTPGAIINHHGGLNDSSSNPPSKLPQLGEGGGIPSPRKLRDASVKIAPPRLVVATTINGA